MLRAMEFFALGREDFDDDDDDDDGDEGERCSIGRGSTTLEGAVRLCGVLEEEEAVCSIIVGVVLVKSWNNKSTYGFSIK